MPFWLFFKKIIHNSKSSDPFDLILILLGALAHWLFSVVTVIDAVSAAILPVWVDFTSLKGLPALTALCAGTGPATTRRGMLVTNG